MKKSKSQSFEIRHRMCENNERNENQFNENLCTSQQPNRQNSSENSFKNIFNEAKLKNDFHRLERKFERRNSNEKSSIQDLINKNANQTQFNESFHQHPFLINNNNNDAHLSPFPCGDCNNLSETKLENRNNNFADCIAEQFDERCKIKPKSHDHKTYNYCKPNTTCDGYKNNFKNDYNVEKHLTHKMNRASRFFYNGVSNHIDRSTPEYQVHAAEYLKFLSSLWMTRTMCDLVFKIESRKRLAHKLGLAMFSKKYREEFQKENKECTYVINLTKTTDCALEAILKYIYTAEIDINPANVDEILSGAKELGIDILVCMAQDYSESLSISDVLTFIKNKFGQEGGESTTYEVYKYVMTHLTKISRTPEFLRASICAVKAILSDSNLCVNSEVEVFEAGMRWLSYDRLDRDKYIVEVFKCVRFTLMTPQEIHSKTECHSIFKDDEDLSTIILNAFKYHSFKCCNDPVLANLIKVEESRNLDLRRASVPDNFVTAIKEMAHIAGIIKAERADVTTNVVKFIECCDNNRSSKIKVCTQECCCTQSHPVYQQKHNCSNQKTTKFDSNNDVNTFIKDYTPTSTTRKHCCVTKESSFSSQ